MLDEQEIVVSDNRPLLAVIRVLDLKKMEGMVDNYRSSTKKIMSPCDVEALKKCLEENKGDYFKCQSQIEAFRSSCSIKSAKTSSDSRK